MDKEKEWLMGAAKVAGFNFDEAELRITALMVAQQDRFELAFATESGGTVQNLVDNWRSDNFDYRHDAYFLRGAWHGWKLRERLSGNDPFMGFLLESANEGELAAYDYGCTGMMAALDRLLTEPLDRASAGVSNEPWESLKRRVLSLRERAEK